MNANFNEINSPIKKDKELSVTKWFNNLVTIIKNYKWLDWFALFCFLIFTVSTAFVIENLVQALRGTNGHLVGWDTLDKFTDQSNVLLWVYMLFYVFFKRHVFLKNNMWLLSNMTYIFFTLIGYNVILIGISGNSYGDDFLSIFQSAWYHVLSPVLFLAFGFCYFYCNPNQQPKVLWKAVLKAMIYPTIYVIYVATIPFVLNPTTYNNGVTYTVYGDFTNLKDHLGKALPVILGMWLIFFPGSYIAFYYSWIGFNKLNNKNK